MCLNSAGDWSNPCDTTVMSHSPSIDVANDTASAPAHLGNRLDKAFCSTNEGGLAGLAVNWCWNHVDKDKRLSRQYHRQKEETLYLHAGLMELEVGPGPHPEIVILRPGDSYQMALDGDHFMGLALDEDNEPNLTQNRLETWIPQVLVAFGIAVDHPESISLVS